MVEQYTAAARAHLDRITAADDPALSLSPAVATDMYRLATALAACDDLDGRFVLGWLHYYRYLALPEGRDQDDLRMAVRAFAVCFVFGPEPLPDPLLPLVAEAALPLVSAVYENAMAEPGVDPIDAAVGLTLKVVDALPPDHPQWIRALVGLGLALHKRFERTGSPADLDIAIDAHRQAVDETPAGNRERPRYLSYLGMALRDRFARGGDLADLDAAIDAHRQAAQTAVGEEDRAGFLGNLSAALHARSEHTGALDDLQAAVAAFRQVLDATPQTHPERGWRLYNLGVGLTQRFALSGAMADLDGGIDAYRQALDTVGADRRLRAQVLNNLGVALRSRYDQIRDPDDLDEAIRLGREAVSARPDGGEDGPSLTNLGVALRQRSDRTGAAVDIDEAVDVSRRAIEATPHGHPNRPAVLNNLALAMRTRYERTGATSDLDAAIQYVQQSVEATPSDAPDRTYRLGNLADSLRERFERTDSLADLDSALEAGHAAVDAASTGHPGRASALAALGALFQRRFERTGTLADLDQSIDLARQAIATEPATARYRSHLANALRLRSRLTGSAEDATAAVSAGQQAVDVAPADDPARPSYLSALGLALRQRYRTVGAAGDLDAAITTARQAVDAGPAGSSARAGYLLNLGDALRERFADTGSGAQEAIAALTQVLDTASAAPAVRIDAARVAASIAAADGSTGLAADLLEQAVSELPRLTPRSLHRTDQEFALSRFGSLATDAAALVLSGNDGGDGDQAPVERAYRLLESGRATLLSQAIDARRANGDPTSPDEARSGPIVVFNVSRYGSDALLLTTSGLIHLPLPDLDANDVVRRSFELRQALLTAGDEDAGWRERSAAQDQVSEVLEWLWDVAAGPVLTALDLNAPSTPPPRVWFVPGGMLSVLPLHAAGYHRPSEQDPPGRTVIDRVIVSHTPTVRALRDARRPPADPTTAHHALIVAMPTTPNGGPLPNALEEAAALRQLLPGSLELTEIGTDPATAPTRTKVLAGLARSRIAHFACHGKSNPFDPGQSTLLLHDHATQPLTVQDLIALDLDHADLAYLSACDTALTPMLHLSEVEIHGGPPPGTGGLADLVRTANRNRGLLDESIHLGSAFQLAGFRHVVGTLWEINDRIAVDIARAFYASLAANPDRLEPSRSAEALRQAVLAIRDRFPRTPTLWAAFLHSGA